MQIKEINIDGFGKWQQKSFQLTSQHLLFFGDNEAGKSTIYQFILGILFGFPQKRGQKSDYAPHSGTFYGGSLLLEMTSKEQVLVKRSRSKAGTEVSVLFADGRVGAEAELQELLAPLNKMLFQEIFTFQQEQLLQISQLNEEHLQQLLLAIGVAGSQQLLSIKTILDKSNQEIYKPTGRFPQLNQWLKNYRELLLKIKEKEQEEASYQEKAATIENLAKEREKLTVKAKKNDFQIRLLDQQLNYWSLYQEYQQLKQELRRENELKMSAAEKQLLSDIFHRSQILSERLTKLDQSQSSQTDQKDSLESYLEKEPLIQEILSQKAVMEKHNETIRWLEKNSLEKKAKVQELTEFHGWDPVDRPDLPSKEQVLKLQETERMVLKAKMELEQNHLLQKNIASEKKQIEQQISFIEEKLELTDGAANTGLFKRTTVKDTGPFSLLIIGTGIIGVVGSFLLSGPTHFMVLLISISLLILGGYFYFFRQDRKKRGAAQLDKAEWQQLYYHLDELSLEQENLLTKEQSYQQSLAVNIQIQQEIGRSNHYPLIRSVTEWLQSFKDMEYCQQLLSDIDQMAIEYEQNQEILQKIDQRFSALDLADLLSDKSLSEKFEQVAAFTKEMELEKQRNRSLINKVEHYRVSLLEAQQQYADLVDKHQDILKHFDVQDLSKIPSLLKSQTQLEKKKQRAEELDQLLAQIFSEGENRSREEIVSDLESREKKAAEYDRKKQGLSEQQQKTAYQIEWMEKDGSLDELYQSRAQLESQIKNLTDKWIENKLESQLILEALEALSQQQLPSVLQKAAGYLAKITEQPAIQIVFQKNRLGLLRENQVFYPLGELSTGTKDQLYMALRLGFIWLHRHNRLSPVIIDDGWLHYDKNRKIQLFEILKEISYDNQVIYFSSDQELLAYFKENRQEIINISEGAEDEKIKRIDRR